MARPAEDFGVVVFPTAAGTRGGYLVRNFVPTSATRKVLNWSGTDMMKVVWSGIGAAAAVVLFSTVAYAQATATANVTATAVVAAKARLEMSGAVAFADADPETVPTINSAPLTLTVKARTSSIGAVTLTVVAGDDLKAGTNAIGIANLTWTSTGGGYIGGTSNKTTAQSLGSWTGPGTFGGSQTYSLANSWAYATGNYSVVLTYTLTSP